jgi:hypothetical protein
MFNKYICIKASHQLAKRSRPIMQLSQNPFLFKAVKALQLGEPSASWLKRELEIGRLMEALLSSSLDLHLAICLSTSTPEGGEDAADPPSAGVGEFPLDRVLYTDAGVYQAE